MGSLVYFYTEFQFIINGAETAVIQVYHSGAVTIVIYPVVNGHF